MRPGLRKLALAAHITTSVGWLGAVLGFLALTFAALTGQDSDRVRVAYLAMEWTTLYAIVPLSIASLMIGVVQSLVSPWGLFRHWWVVVKLVLTVIATVVLLQYTQTMSYIADVAATTSSGGAHLRELAPSPLVHAGGGLLVLLTATVLSVYKPPGLTPYGWRKQEEQRRQREQS